MSIAAALPLRPAQQRDPLLIFLIVSLLVHLLILLLWPHVKRAEPPLEQLTEVELLPPDPLSPPQIAQAPPQVVEPKPPPEPKKEEPQPVPEVPDQQIVSVPDEVNDQVPDETRFLSDRNTAVEEEQVAVGTPLTTPPQERQPAPDGTSPDTPQAERPAQPAPRTPAEQPRPRQRPKPQLFARQDNLLSEGWLSDDGDAQKEQAERSPPTGNELLAMAPPPARENYLTMPGPRGTLDHLPDVRKGNLTFLNTKASRFAPFVRRVAQRVFQHLLIRQRRNLQADDVVAARHPVQIQAKLSEQGTLLGLTMHTRSGSYAVDESLLDACQQGAWDENPPPEAQADDGNYYFIFRSRINARVDAGGLRAILTYLEVGLV